VYETKLIEVVFPHLAGMSFEQVDDEGDAVRISVRSRRGDAACPGCATVSAAVHSRYQRRLADLPVGGRPVSIVVAVRRFVWNRPRWPPNSFRPRSGAQAPAIRPPTSRGITETVGITYQVDLDYSRFGFPHGVPR
jgi:transposase